MVEEPDYDYATLGDRPYHRSTRDGESGIVFMEEYGLRGHLHRIDGPAKILRCPHTGELEAEAYYKEGKLHRLDGPALVYYGREGTTTIEDWYKDGLLHREGGPASSGRSDKGDLIDLEVYHKLMHIDGVSIGAEHRDPLEGPAHLLIRGDTLENRYCWKDQLHRDPADGPADLVWDTRTGALKSATYYVHGEKVEPPPLGAPQIANLKPIFPQWRPSTPTRGPVSPRRVEAPTPAAS